jgi:hypothetical protein
VETGPQVAALEEEVQRLRQAAEERKQKGEKQVFFFFFFINYCFLFTLWVLQESLFVKEKETAETRWRNELETVKREAARREAELVRERDGALRRENGAKRERDALAQVQVFFSFFFFFFFFFRRWKKRGKMTGYKRWLC